MPGGGSARRHAQAVFQIAQERHELEQWRNDLGKIAEAMDNLSLRMLLASPKLSLQEKMDLAGQSLKGISPLALSLVGVLTARGRLGLAAGMMKEYERLLNSHQGIEEAEVVSAIPLEDAEQDLLRQRLSQLLGKKVILRSRTDPHILGGLVVRTEELVLDGSAKSKLEGLKKSLLEAGR